MKSHDSQLLKLVETQLYKAYENFFFQQYFISQNDEEILHDDEICEKHEIIIVALSLFY